jgi:hypothetical protein
MTQRLHCLSIDITLDSTQKLGLIEAVHKALESDDSVEVQVKSLSWRQVFRLRREWKTVTVFFAGYNLERYGPNLFKHLLLFPGRIMGVNIDGRVFSLPRLRVLVLLLRQGIWDRISAFFGWLYEMAMSGNSTVSSR